MKFITDLFSKLSLKDKLLIKAAVVILLMFAANVYSCNRNKNLKEDLVRTEHNLKAAQDTIRVNKAKDGSIEYDKLSYIAEDVKELKKLNGELAKELAATKGKVAAIQKIGVQIIHDTIPIEIEKPVVRDGVAIINGFYDTTYSAGNYRKLKTQTNYNLKDSSAIQKILQDEIGFTAITGIKSTDKGYEIFLRPKYPGMTVTSLEGAIVEKNFFNSSKSKTPLITIGGSIGYTPITYDLKDKNFSFSGTRLGATLGLNFNLNRK